MFIAAPRNGLDHAGIDGGDEIDGCVQVFFRHTGFQRPLDASVTSRLATATHGDRQPDERLFAFGQACVGLGLIEITTKRIWFSHIQLLVSFPGVIIMLFRRASNFYLLPRAKAEASAWPTDSMNASRSRITSRVSTMTSPSGIGEILDRSRFCRGSFRVSFFVRLSRSGGFRSDIPHAIQPGLMATPAEDRIHCAVQQAALFEVFQQRPNRLIALLG